MTRIIPLLIVALLAARVYGQSATRPEMSEKDERALAAWTARNDAALEKRIVTLEKRIATLEAVTAQQGTDIDALEQEVFPPFTAPWLSTSIYKQNVPGVPRTAFIQMKTGTPEQWAADYRDKLEGGVSSGIVIADIETDEPNDDFWKTAWAKFHHDGPIGAYHSLDPHVAQYNVFDGSPNPDVDIILVIEDWKAKGKPLMAMIGPRHPKTAEPYPTKLIYWRARWLHEAGFPIVVWSSDNNITIPPWTIAEAAELGMDPREYGTQHDLWLVEVCRCAVEGEECPPDFAAPTEPPPGGIPEGYSLAPIPASGPILLDDQSFKYVTGEMVDRADAILVNNDQEASHVIIENFTATGMTRSGIYIGDGVGWTLRNVTITDNPAGTEDERALRVASCDGLNIDTMNLIWPGKSPIWLLKVKNLTMKKVVTTGGAWRLGVKTSDSHLGTGQCEDAVIDQFHITKSSGGDANAIEAWPGCKNVTLTNGVITGGSFWLSIDSVNTSNIRWSNITWNGQKVTGYDGVRLGGMTVEQAQARGIGPIEE